MCVYVFVVFVYLFFILAGKQIYKDLAEVSVCHEGVGGVGGVGVGMVNPLRRHLRDVAYIYIYIYIYINNVCEASSEGGQAKIHIYTYITKV